MNIYLFLIGLFISSFLLTFAIRYIALKRNVLDIPNERSSHSVPTPRGGGLSIVITWFTGLCFLFYAKIIPQNLFYALVSGIVLAFISLVDDLISLKPDIRLIAQASSVVLALYFLHGTDIHLIPGLFVIDRIFVNVLVGLGIIWFINLYNFLDGIDGYASYEAILVAGALFVFTGNILTILLFVCVLGFLFWNWPKARIFMGDVGSTQLGFIIAVLGIYFNNTINFSIIYWLMLTSVFWFDGTYTLIRRLKNGEKLSKAHKKHAYQRIVQAGFSHVKTVNYAIGINLIIFGFTILASFFTYLLIPLFLINILFLLLIYKKIDKMIPFDQ